MFYLPPYTGSGVRPFHYTNVHTSSAEQHEVYGKSAQDAVASVLNGFNACIMCYGQTGMNEPELNIPDIFLP